MKVAIQLNMGEIAVEALNIEVPYNNDFSTASMMAVMALFARDNVDNVAVYRKYDDGTIAKDHFFYGEKG